MRFVAYIDHPYGDALGFEDTVQQYNNLAQAVDWVRFLLDTTQLVILCPWYVYTIAHSSNISTPRRLIDSIEALSRADILIQVGGYLTPHMHMLATSARRHGIPIVDLTSFGIIPPDKSDEDIVAHLIQKIKRVVDNAVPRRVWMPLLTDEDLNALKKVRHAIDFHLVDEHPVAVAVIDRILNAVLDPNKGS